VTVRGIDDAGCLIIGLTRADIERLMAGERVCSNPFPVAPGPHLCIYAAETDQDLLTRLADRYPADCPVEDHRGEPGWGQHREGRP
jgi:hypothetical protein